MGRAVLQYSHCTRDTTRGARWASAARRRWALGARHRRAGRAAQARWARGRAGRAGGREARARGRARSTGARGALHGRWARDLGVLLSIALGALSLFLTRFDSVLFLSQFLDIVCEPGS